MSHANAMLSSPKISSVFSVLDLPSARMQRVVTFLIPPPQSGNKETHTPSKATLFCLNLPTR